MFQLLLRLIPLFVVFNLSEAQHSRSLFLILNGWNYPMEAQSATSKVLLKTSSTGTPPITQQFYFDEFERLKVKIDATNERCVADMGSSTDILKASVQLQVCSTALNQKWYWDSIVRNRIKSRNNDLRCLDLSTDTIVANAEVITSGCSDSSDKQNWNRNFDCQAGEEPNTAADACQSCVAGQTYKKNQGFMKCAPCPGNSSCSLYEFQCKSGFQRSDDKMSCVQCINSYKPTNDNSLCIDCPPNSVCNSTVFSCFPGKQINFMGSGCSTCGAYIPALDTTLPPYKPEFGDGPCRPCPTGATCASSNAVFFNCNAGYQLNPTNTGCDECLAPDWYNPQPGNGTCRQCPDNAECVSIQFRCKAGFELINGQCSQCAEGWAKSAAGNHSCIQCGDGRESSPDRTTCIDCAPRYYRPNTFISDKCINCPNNSTCDNFEFWCHPGFTINAAGNDCEMCVPSRVKNWEGNEVCDQCPIGFESNYESTDCQLCNEGQTYRSSLDMGTCIPCPANAVCDFTSFTCNPSYRINDTLSGCVQCPIATEVSGDKKNCSICKSGFYRSVLTQNTCEPCPANSACYPDHFECDYGYIYNAATKQCVLTFCRSGQYLGNMFGMSMCLECPYYSICTAKSFSCLEGYGYVGGINNCTECDVGHFKTGTGNWACVKCVSLGKEVTSDRSKCVDCKDGFFKPSSQFDTCISCPENARCSTSEYFCLPGYTKNDNSTYGCTKCPVSTYKSIEGTQECTACPAGSYSNPDFTLCIPCPSGYIKTANETCFQCPAGTEPSHTKGACQPCNKGFYRSLLTSSKCDKCPTGSDCTATGFKCPEGFASNLEAKTCESTSLDFSSNPGAVTGLSFGIIAVLGLAVFAFVRLRDNADPDSSPPAYSTFSRNGNGTFSRNGITSSATALTKSGSNSNLYSLNNLSQSKPSLQSPSKSRSGSANQLSASVNSIQMPEPVQPYGSGSWNNATLSIRGSAPEKSSKGFDSWGNDASGGSGMNTLEVGIPANMKFIPNVDFGPDKILQQEDIYTVFMGKSSNQALTLINGTQVIIKEVIKQENRPDIDIFFAEIQVILALKEHPNIAKISGYSVDPYCLLMKHYPLGSLETWLGSSKFIKRKAIILSFAKDAVSALSHMHKNGYAHCAIRPSNLVMELNGSGKLICLLTGFTSAQRNQQQQSTMTRGMSVSSTSQKLPQRQSLLKYSVMAYAAPEIISAAKIPTPRRVDLFKADIFALAVLLQHMATRKMPWSK